MAKVATQELSRVATVNKFFFRNSVHKYDNGRDESTYNKSLYIY